MSLVCKRVIYLLLNYKQCCSYQKYSTCHPSAPKTQSCDKTAKSYITLSETLIRILSDTFELLTPRIEGVLLSDHFKILNFFGFLLFQNNIEFSFKKIQINKSKSIIYLVIFTCFCLGSLTEKRIKSLTTSVLRLGKDSEQNIGDITLFISKNDHRAIEVCKE